MKKEILEALLIPKDAVLNQYNVTLMGNEKVFIEGFEGIREISEKLLKLKVKNGFITIEGEKLNINYFHEGEILILGVIKSLRVI